MLLLAFVLAAQVLVDEHQTGCRADAGDVFVAEQEIVWRRQGGRELRCSLPGFEPYDLLVSQSSPEEIVVRLVPARLVTVNSLRATPEMVEWLRVTDSQEPPIATRTLDTTNSAHTLAVASQESRLLRFTWKNRGVRTVSAGGDAVLLDPPPRGAEIIAIAGSRRVLPQRLTASGNEGTTKDVPFTTDGFAAIGDLAPGRYEVSFVYQGGIRRGVDDAVEVQRRDQSVRIPVPLAGALDVVIREQDCAELPSQFRLPVTVERWDDGQRIARDHVSERLCSLRFAGLSPDTYVVTIGDDASSPRSAPLRVARDAVTTYEADFEPTILLGNVKIGDEPATELLVLIHSQTFRDSRTTDRDGTFLFQLPSPGEYEIEFRPSEYVPSGSHRVVVKRGRQERDFVLAGGRLRVKVLAPADAGETAAQVVLTGPATTRTAIAQAPERQADFINLELATYQVRASAPPNLGSDTVTVRLDENRPKDDVVLRLSEGVDRTLSLLDGSGRPLREAHVQIGAMVTRETAPGIYPLPASAGDRLYITVPNHLPVCRMLATHEQALTITMGQGSFEAVVIGEGPPPVTIAGLPNSTCPVSLAPLTANVTRHANRYRTLLRGLPPGDFQLLFPDGRAAVLRVPQQEAVVIP